MKKVLALTVLAACGLAFAVPAPASAFESRLSAASAEKIDNLMYQNWAKFKPGTSVKTKVISDFGGQKNEIISTTSLVEVTAEKVVIEIKSSANYGGQTMDMPPQKMDFPAKVDKMPEGEKPKDEVKPKTGEEEIEVAGKKYKTKWTESVNEQNGMKTTSKVWTSEEFPGMTLKMQTTMEGAMSGSTSSEVMEVKMG